MKTSLIAQAALKLSAGLLTISLLLFLPAGIDYWNGWLLIILLFVPMLLVGSILWKKSPELLAKRLASNEQQRPQRQVILASLIMFVGGFLIAGFDFRYHWSQLPTFVVVIAALVLLLSYGMYAEVLRENAYLSRVVEIQKDQQVIDTGLYGLVRHPMYVATILLFLSMPLVLGSFYAFLIFLIYPFLIVQRIKNEEALLIKELDGYLAYTRKVRYRLLPFIW